MCPLCGWPVAAHEIAAVPARRLAPLHSGGRGAAGGTVGPRDALLSGRVAQEPVRRLAAGHALGLPAPRRPLCEPAVAPPPRLAATRVTPLPSLTGTPWLNAVARGGAPPTSATPLGLSPSSMVGGRLLGVPNTGVRQPLAALVPSLVATGSAQLLSMRQPRPTVRVSPASAAPSAAAAGGPRTGAADGPASAGTPQVKSPAATDSGNVSKCKRLAHCFALLTRDRQYYFLDKDRCDSGLEYVVVDWHGMACPWGDAHDHGVPRVLATVPLPCAVREITHQVPQGEPAVVLARGNTRLPLTKLVGVLDMALQRYTVSPTGPFRVRTALMCAKYRKADRETVAAAVLVDDWTIRIFDTGLPWHHYFAQLQPAAIGGPFREPVPLSVCPARRGNRVVTGVRWNFAPPALVAIWGGSGVECQVLPRHHHRHPRIFGWSRRHGAVINFHLAPYRGPYRSYFAFGADGPELVEVLDTAFAECEFLGSVVVRVGVDAYFNETFHCVGTLEGTTVVFDKDNGSGAAVHPVGLNVPDLGTQASRTSPSHSGESAYSPSGGAEPGHGATTGGAHGRASLFKEDAAATAAFVALSAQQPIPAEEWDRGLSLPPGDRDRWLDDVSGVWADDAATDVDGAPQTTKKESAALAWDHPQLPDAGDAFGVRLARDQPGLRTGRDSPPASPTFDSQELPGTMGVILSPERPASDRRHVASVPAAPRPPLPLGGAAAAPSASLFDASADETRCLPPPAVPEPQSSADDLDGHDFGAE